MWKRELMRPWFLLSASLFLSAIGILFSNLLGAPAYTKILVKEGYPLSREELEKRYYTPVPEEENAALLYLEAYDRMEKLGDSSNCRTARGLSRVIPEKLIRSTKKIYP